MTENLEAILHDLLHPTLSIRKGGFNRFKAVFNDSLKNHETSDWKNLREFLWKAIEIEDDKINQAKLVEYCIIQLQEKSIRKLIRLAETNILKENSLKILASHILDYYNPKIIEFLAKSIQRENSKTSGLINKIMDFLSLYFNSSENHIDFLNNLFESDISDDLKRVFSSHLFSQSTSSSVRSLLINNLLMNNDNCLQEELLIKIPKDILYWGKQNNLLEDIEFAEIDIKIIHSLYSMNEKIRYNAIKSISQFIKPAIFVKSENDILFDFWEELEKNNLERIYWENNEYDYQSLRILFNCDEESESDISLNFNCGIIDGIFAFDVNQNELLHMIKLNIPRKIISELSREDPSLQNRIFCYQNLLLNLDFNFHIDGFPTGTLYYWKKLVYNTIDTIVYERDPEIRYLASKTLGRILMNFSDDTFSSKLLIDLKDDAKFQYKLNLIENKNLDRFAIFNLNIKVFDKENQEILFDDLLEETDIVILDLLDSLLIPEVYNWDYLTRLIEMNIVIVNLTFLNKLIEMDVVSIDDRTKRIISLLKNDNDIEIRNKAYHLENKIKEFS